MWKLAAFPVIIYDMRLSSYYCCQVKYLKKKKDAAQLAATTTAAAANACHGPPPPLHRPVGSVPSWFPTGGRIDLTLLSLLLALNYAWQGGTRNL